MTTKQVATRWFEELWNQKKPETIPLLMSAEAAGVTEAGPIKGPAEFRAQVYDVLIGAFPDLKIDIVSLIAEGDEVALRWTATGTHHGALAHIPASGRRVRFSGMTWFCIRHGQIAGGSDSYNMHGLADYLITGNPSATVQTA